MKKALNVEEFVKELKLTPIYKSTKKEIEVNTSDDVMAQLKPNPSRWSTLDTSEV